MSSELILKLIEFWKLKMMVSQMGQIVGYQWKYSNKSLMAISKIIWQMYRISLIQQPTT